MENLRTVIVTADIHQGLYQSAHLCLATEENRRYLTFWHWSGVTPYTSSCEFAGSCVFGKQLSEILSLRPSPILGSTKLFFSLLRSSYFPFPLFSSNLCVGLSVIPIYVSPEKSF